MAYYSELLFCNGVRVRVRFRVRVRVRVRVRWRTAPSHCSAAACP